jgi:hypothetical protein
MEAVIALIPLFIVLAAIVNMSGDFTTSQQIRIAQDAQDTLEIMAQYRNGTNPETVLQTMAMFLMINQNNKTGLSASGLIAGSFLNQTLRGMKYNITEVNQLDGTTIASNANMADAENIAVSSRSFGNYVFKLYVWDQ